MNLDRFSSEVLDHFCDLGLNCVKFSSRDRIWNIGILYLCSCLAILTHNFFFFVLFLFNAMFGVSETVAVWDLSFANYILIRAELFLYTCFRC